MAKKTTKTSELKIIEGGDAGRKTGRMAHNPIAQKHRGAFCVNRGERDSHRIIQTRLERKNSRPWVVNPIQNTQDSSHGFFPFQPSHFGHLYLFEKIVIPPLC